MEGSELLAAIVDAPDDDAPRLVYADWLAQQGDPHGELIALQVELERADANDVRIPERPRIVARVRELLRAHKHAWTARLRGIAPATYLFRRGFVDRVMDYQARNLGFVAEQLLAEAPLLRAADVTAGQLHGVIMNEAMARFAELRFRGPDLDDQLFARLRERLTDGALRSIDLEEPYLRDRDVYNSLVRWPIAVEHFGLAMKQKHGVPIGGSFLANFAASGPRDALRSLRLERAQLGNVVQPPTMVAVEHLVLVGCELGRAYGNLKRIVSATPALTSLSVATDRVSVEELADVVAACPQLRRLSLCRLALSSIEPLLPLAPQLRRLELIGNHLGDDAARRILDGFPHLVTLRFTGRQLSAATREALRARFGGRGSVRESDDLGEA